MTAPTRPAAPSGPPAGRDPARWPLHPQPGVWEALSSWIGRLATVYGLPVAALIEDLALPAEIARRHAGTGRTPTERFDVDVAGELLAALAGRTGVDAGRLRAMTLAGWTPWLFEPPRPRHRPRHRVRHRVRFWGRAGAPRRARRGAGGVRDLRRGPLGATRPGPRRHPPDRPPRPGTAAQLARAVDLPAPAEPGVPGLRGRPGPGPGAGPDVGGAAGLGLRPARLPARRRPRAAPGPGAGRDDPPHRWAARPHTRRTAVRIHVRAHVRGHVRARVCAAVRGGRREPLATLDRYTYQALATGHVELPRRAVHAAVWFRMLRAILDEVSLVPPHVAGRALLERVWETAGVPARGGVRTWRPYEFLDRASQDRLLLAAAAAVQLAAAGEIAPRGRLGTLLSPRPPPAVWLLSDGEPPDWLRHRADRNPLRVVDGFVIPRDEVQPGGVLADAVWNGTTLADGPAARVWRAAAAGLGRTVGYDDFVAMIRTARGDPRVARQLLHLLTAAGPASGGPAAGGGPATARDATTRDLVHLGVPEQYLAPRRPR